MKIFNMAGVIFLLHFCVIGPSVTQSPKNGDFNHVQSPSYLQRYVLSALGRNYFAQVYCGCCWHGCNVIVNKHKGVTYAHSFPAEEDANNNGRPTHNYNVSSFLAHARTDHEIFVTKLKEDSAKNIDLVKRKKQQAQ